MRDLPTGTRVLVRQWDGQTRWDTVREYDEDIKNGRPGYSLTSNHWCYSDQIVKAEESQYEDGHSSGS